MPRSSQTRPPNWRRVLVDKLDPDGSIRDLIDERIEQYDRRRSGNSSEPPTDSKGR